MRSWFERRPPRLAESRRGTDLLATTQLPDRIGVPSPSPDTRLASRQLPSTGNSRLHGSGRCGTVHRNDLRGSGWTS